MQELRNMSLGDCTSIALRMMFLRQHTDNTKANGGGGQEIAMGNLRELLRCSHLDLDTLLRVPVASFCDDIVTPYTVDRNLPLIVLCEPFSDDLNPDDDLRTRPPRKVTIDLPEQFEMRWEKDRKLLVAFAERKRSVHLVDSVTFFPSGLFAYSVSLVLDERDAGLNGLDPDFILVLSAIAQPAGEIVGEPVRFTFSEERDAKPVPLMAFLGARLSKLADEGRIDHNIFSLLDRDVAVKAFFEQDESDESPKSKKIRAKRKACDVDALRNSLIHLFLENDGRFDGRILVDVEVLGFSNHDKVLEYARLSQTREAQVDKFSKSLAGLTQNVLDYMEQDEEEINDSLAGALIIGSDITFVSRDVAVKFCRRSRVTSEMRYVVGGSPYWMLVQLVMGHNEALLADLNADIDAQCGQAGMIGALLEQKDPYDVETSRERSNQALKRKIRLAYYIPNLFRYLTEQHLYRFFSEARGLKLRQRYLVGSEAAWDNAVRETGTVTKEQTDHTFSGIVIALGVIQLGGVLAAIAAIDDKHFWYFGTRVFQKGAFTHALVDLWDGFFHIDNGAQPQDFSAVWALAIAGSLILAGSLYLIPLAAKWILLWLKGTPRMLFRVRQKLSQWSGTVDTGT